MRVKTIFIHFVLPSMIIFFDQVSKYMAAFMDAVPIIEHSFDYMKNYGIIFGIFSDLPEKQMNLVLITLLTCAVTAYCAFVYVFKRKWWAFRAGISLMLSGIVGNSIDKIAHGYVIDWITLQPFISVSPYFNLADTALMIGYVFVIGAILFYRGEPKEDQILAYKLRWVLPELQRKIIGSYLLVFSLTFLMNFIYSFAYFYFTFEEMDSNNIEKGEFIRSYANSIVGIFAVQLIVFLAYSKTIASQISRPLYRFQQFVWRLRKDKNARYYIESDDFFEELDQVSRNVRHIANEKKDRAA